MEDETEIIEVFVVDSNKFYCSGIRSALADCKDIEIVGDADLDEDTIEKIDEFCPDVVLLDVNMPLFNGLDLARQITQHSPQVRVVVTAPYEDDNQFFQAIKSGALAYLTKNVNINELTDIIRRVHHGEYVITESLLARPKVAERVLKQFQDIASMGLITEKVAAPLTNREIQILDHIANGNSNKQIAYTIGVSEQTIKNHVSAILRKLNANDRAHAVALAMHNQWVSVDRK